MERIPLPSPEEARDLILSTLKKPTILEMPAGSWARNQPFWTPSNLGQVAGETRTEFRVWPRQLSCLVWENECKHVGCSFSEFSDWLDREELGPDEEYRHNPFRAASLTTQDVCVYAAYKNMEEIFGSESIFSKAVTWEPFGFKGRGSRQTTFWCGTSGSYTPCHFDTYGCNVVVQLHGHKRWTLFSPDDTPYLYSTRLPYEESSVFSEVNIGQPDLDEHPLFRKATPIQVRVSCFPPFLFKRGFLKCSCIWKQTDSAKWLFGAALDKVSWHKWKALRLDLLGVRSEVLTSRWRRLLAVETLAIDRWHDRTTGEDLRTRSIAIEVTRNTSGKLHALSLDRTRQRTAHACSACMRENKEQCMDWSWPVTMHDDQGPVEKEGGDGGALKLLPWPFGRWTIDSSLPQSTACFRGCSPNTGERKLKNRKSFCGVVGLDGRCSAKAEQRNKPVAVGPLPGAYLSTETNLVPIRGVIKKEFDTGHTHTHTHTHTELKRRGPPGPRR